MTDAHKKARIGAIQKKMAELREELAELVAATPEEINEAHELMYDEYHGHDWVPELFEHVGQQIVLDLREDEEEQDA